jgi:rhodanese-related sulfurtransferase
MSYAGDVSPTEAWTALENDPRAVLVDVRTEAEWAYVGLPDLSPLGREVVRLEWQRYPDGLVNQHFVEELSGAGIEKDQPLYFICRSGARSISAAEAATAAGWAEARNVLEGFEGPHGPERHRDVGGWKVAGLPWVQA